MLIALTGYKGVGKSTVADILVDKFKFTKMGFADPLKEMALMLDPIVDELHGERLSDVVHREGWVEAKKNYEIRRILQVLGTECGRDILGKDVWINYL